MTDIEIKLPIHHAGQLQVLAGKSRYNTLTCGRRWGKSLFGVDRIIDTPRLGILDGKPCGWFAATNKLADEAWLLAVKTLAPITSRKDTQHRRIECITGGSLEVWSLESEGCGLGRRYGVAVVDEAAIAKNLKIRFMREIRPTLTDFEGEAWFLTTPRGRIGDYWDLHKQGGVRPGWASFQMPTATNPHINPDEIEEARQGYLDMGRPDLFEQEYLAQFVMSTGAIYNPGKVNFGKLPRLDHLYMGVDPALTASDIAEGDETAICVMGIDDRGRWWIVDLIHGRWGADGVGERIMAAMEEYDPDIVWLEGGPAGLGCEPYVRRCMDDANAYWRLDMMSHLRDKAAKAVTAAGLCNTGKLWVPEGAEWWPALRDQMAVFDGRGAEHDDLVDALGIVARGCRSMQSTRAEKEKPVPLPPRAGKAMLPKVVVARKDIRQTGLGAKVGHRTAFPGRR